VYGRAARNPRRRHAEHGAGLAERGSFTIRRCSQCEFKRAESDRGAEFSWRQPYSQEVLSRGSVLRHRLRRQRHHGSTVGRVSALTSAMPEPGPVVKLRRMGIAQRSVRCAVAQDAPRNTVTPLFVHDSGAGCIWKGTDDGCQGLRNA
jgi:hypothetical protein